MSHCGGDIEGVFYLSDEARKYQFDTTIYSFIMVDNYGIMEEFYMDRNIWYTIHHYFTEWGTDGKASGETFGVAYYSALNDYFFMFVLRAQVEYTDMEIEWNQRDKLVYNFRTKKVTTGVEPDIFFYDSLSVRNISYGDIIEIDYSDNINAIDMNTPVKTYISGEKGLIKFIRKDNIIFERVE
jgi:hypothetical protein